MMRQWPSTVMVEHSGCGSDEEPALPDIQQDAVPANPNKSIDQTAEFFTFSSI